MSLTRAHGNARQLPLSLLSTLLGEPRPAAAVGALVDGESNGNLQPTESECANIAGSGNRHTMCRQRAYLFTIDTDVKSPHALAEHCKATIAKRRDPTCSQALRLTHPTHRCAATHAPCMLPLQRCHPCHCCSIQIPNISIPNLYMYPYSKVRGNT